MKHNTTTNYTAEDTIRNSLKEWAYDLFNNSVYVDQVNCAYIRQKLNDNGHPDFRVYRRISSAPSQAPQPMNSDNAKASP